MNMVMLVDCDILTFQADEVTQSLPARHFKYNPDCGTSGGVYKLSGSEWAI